MLPQSKFWSHIQCGEVLQARRNDCVTDKGIFPLETLGSM